MKNKQYILASMVTIIWGLIFWGFNSNTGVYMLVAAIATPIFARLFPTHNNQVIDNKFRAIRINNLNKYTN